MLKIPGHLAVFQPASELWGQMAINMIFLQPQRVQTNVCKPSRLSKTYFENMEDATNPVCSTSSELFLWHTQKLDAWHRKSTCSTQPSRKISQIVAAGPFVLLGVKIAIHKQNSSMSLESTALLSQIMLIPVDFSVTFLVHSYVASRLSTSQCTWLCLAAKLSLNVLWRWELRIMAAVVCSYLEVNDRYQPLPVPDGECLWC